METMETEPATKGGNKGRLRYAVAFLLLCGVAFNYIIKVMLSVAIVAMVKEDDDSDNTTIANHTLLDTCPGKVPRSKDNDGNGVFEWDAVMQGNILSAYFYGYVATQFLGGWAADRFSGRWVFGLGVFMTGVSSVFSPLAADADPVAFMVLRAFQGIFSGVLLPAATVIISRWFTLTERPRIAGIVFSANYVGTLISMSLSGVLVETLNWRSVFYVFGGACILYGLPWFYIVYDVPEVHPRISETEKQHILSGRDVHSDKTQEEKKIVEQERKAMPIPWLRILTSIPFWAAALMHFGSTWLNYTLMTELPTYTEKILHFDIEDSGFISALPYLFAWVFGGLFGTLSSWLRQRGYVSQLAAYRIFNGIGSVGPAIFLLVITLIGCDTTLIVVCLVITATMKCGFYGGSITNVLDLAPNFAGTMSGIYYTVVNLSGILSPLVTGAITEGHQTLTRWHTIFYISMAICVVPYVLYLIFGTVKEQSWNKPKVKKVKTEKSTETA
ncbi:sialin [Anabrus simplex]|uniref:sialin n=1 Tax=Anabrus simplex TaxID=316456 RepID=UPI0035A2F9F8